MKLPAIIASRVLAHPQWVMNSERRGSSEICCVNYAAQLIYSASPIAFYSEWVEWQKNQMWKYSLRSICFWGVKVASIRFSTPSEILWSGFWMNNKISPKPLALYSSSQHVACQNERDRGRKSIDTIHSSWYRARKLRMILTSYFHTNVISGNDLMACTNDCLYPSGISDDRAMVPNEMRTVRGRREKMASQCCKGAHCHDVDPVTSFLALYHRSVSG